MFKENSPKYMCCCGKLHIRIGAFIVAFMGLFLVLLKFFITLGFCLSMKQSWPLIGTIVLAFIHMFSMLLFLKGLRFIRPYPIKQYTAMQILQLTVSVLLIGFSLFCFHIHSEKLNNLSKISSVSERRMVRFATFIAAFSLAASLTAVFFESWFLVVCFKTIYYITDKRKAMLQNGLYHHSSRYHPNHRSTNSKRSATARRQSKSNQQILPLAVSPNSLVANKDFLAAVSPGTAETITMERISEEESDTGEHS